MGDEPHSGHALRDQQTAVDPRQPDRVDAKITQPGDQLAVDDAAQDRCGNLEGRGVGDPKAALEAALDPEAIEPLGDPPATAVDEDDRPAPRDRRDLAEHLRLIGDRGPTELDDKNFTHVVYSEFSIT